MTRVSDLLGVDVHTESGEKLGRVFDLRGELTSRTLRITGVAVGGLALLERLGIGAMAAELEAALQRGEDAGPLDHRRGHRKADQREPRDRPRLRGEAGSARPP